MLGDMVAAPPYSRESQAWMMRRQIPNWRGNAGSHHSSAARRREGRGAHQRDGDEKVYLRPTRSPTRPKTRRAERATMKPAAESEEPRPEKDAAHSGLEKNWVR